MSVPPTPENSFSSLNSQFENITIQDSQSNSSGIENLRETTSSPLSSQTLQLSDRIAQIKDLTDLPMIIDKPELLEKIAETVEDLLSLVSINPITKLSKKASKLPSSIYIDKINGYFHLKTLDKLGRGGNNKVLGTISIPFSTKQEIIHGALRMPMTPSLPKRISSPIAASNKKRLSHLQKMKLCQEKCDLLYQKSLAELKETQRLQKEEQKPYSAFVHEKPYKYFSNVNLDRICTVEPFLPGDLSQFPIEEDLKKIEVAIQTVDHLQSIHNKGIIHNDLKINNVLWDMFEDNSVDAYITDFGMSFSTNGPFNRVYAHGYYGVEIATPPEMLGLTDPDSIKNLDHFAVERFACGALLLKLFFKESLPWVNVLYSISRTEVPSHRPIKPKEKEWILARMNDFFKNQDETHSQNNNSISISQQLRKAILSLMHMDPKQRISLDDFQKELKRLYQTGSSRN